MKFYTNYFRKALGLLMLATVGLHVNAQSVTNLASQLQAKDSLLFNSVLKTCDMEQIENSFTKNFEYYQDKADGSAPHLTPRAEFISNIQRRCSNKNASFSIRREMVKSDVSLADPATAMQTGIQRFFLTAGGNPEQMIEESHFIRIWKMEKDKWEISRELDYQIVNPSPQDAANPHDALYKQVVGADSTLFAAYNNRDIEGMKTMLSEDLEFYHDKGGLSHYTDNIENFEKHFKDTANFSRRELVEGSAQVYPLNNYGAVEMGEHRFYSQVNGKEQLTATANFINTWHFVSGKWKLCRVISYDHH